MYAGAHGRRGRCFDAYKNGVVRRIGEALSRVTPTRVFAAREQRTHGRESEHRGGATKKGERRGAKGGKERRGEARLRVAKRVLVRTENEAVRASRTGVRFANARVGSFT